MSTRITFEPVVVSVPHTCTTHALRTTEFHASSVRHYDSGAVLYTMTRCDGSPMDVWGDEPGVTVRRVDTEDGAR